MAQDESAWDGDARSAARLISGGATSDALHAGIEIRLAPGWKTYWRYPGDSGVPPRLDHAGSENVRDVEVIWPAPFRFTDAGGTSIGYKENVVFPLRITPREAGKPVKLRIKLDYAVCEKLCVPAEANMTLPLGGAAHRAAILAAEAKAPKAVALGAPGPLAIASVRRVAKAATPLVVVDVVAPAGAEVEVFAEGPNADWALPIPMPAPGAPPGRRHFGFTLEGLPPGVDPNRPLTIKLTAVSGAQAIEVTTHLD